MTAPQTQFDWIPDLFGFLGRAWRSVAGGLAIMVVLALIYLLTATPRFTANVTLLIDSTATASFQQQATTTDAQYANGVVESQVEVLQSMGVAREVVRTLHLARDPAFLVNGKSLLASVTNPVMRLFESAVKPTPEGEETAAAELLTKMIKVKRIGTSFVLDMGVTATDRVMAARLANTLIESFIDAGLNARSGNTKRASVWLQQRLGELRAEALSADTAVQSFKATANIVDTDKGLMNERHLGELNSQLVLARARVSDARSRHDQVVSLMQHGIMQGDVPDAIQDNVIVHLREEYADDARQAAEWESRFGPQHKAVVQMRAKLHDVETQLQNEMHRLADGYASDYQAALANQTDIETQLQRLVGDADGTNQKLVTLRALQSSADTYKSLYENFLQRYTQAMQDQSFPVSETRIVTAAVPPLRKSQPKGLIVLAVASFLGMAGGFALAFLREQLDQGLRSAREVRAALGVPCLALLPVIADPRTHGLLARKRLPAATIRAGGAAHGTRVLHAPRLLRHAVDAPHAPFAEALRGVRLRAGLGRNGGAIGVVGFVSAMPGEGKSTLSSNFAFVLAQAGYRTLLLDLDFRKQALTRALAPQCQAGFAEVLAGEANINDVLWQDAAGLRFLPACASTRPRLPPEAARGGFSGPEAQALLRGLREQFDAIIVDLPAMATVADAGGTAPLLDGVVMAVRWGRTPQVLVQECIESAELKETRLLGAVLTLVEPRALRNYYGMGGTYAARDLAPV
jgi:succinoglycan biosynthesis transport protein ExoP